MSQETILITGASSGIGKATAHALAQSDTQLILVCRDQNKGNAVKEEIYQTSKKHPALYIADLSSQDSIRKLIAQIKSQHSRIDILINNAGIINNHYSETVDGIETTFTVNHLAPFMLTTSLLDLLRQSQEGKIITVSSSAHKRTNNTDTIAPLTREVYSGWKAYGQSKLANILFTYELSRRISGTRMTANCLHPGLVATNFGSNNDDIFRKFMNTFKHILKSPAQGAETVLYLATSPKISEVSGKYFVNQKQKQSSQLSYNTQLAHKLWDLSEHLTKS